MMFGQLSNRESLRDLIVAFEAHRAKQYHLGVGREPIAKTTLASANQNRDCRIFEDFAFYMMKEACEKRATNIIDIPGKKYAFDSTTISLCLSTFPWAKFRRKKGGVKAHVLYDIEAQVPAFYTVTTASKHDSTAMSSIPYEPNAYYIFDRAYDSFKELYYWCPLKFFACNKIRLNPSLGIQPFLLPLFSPQKTSNMNKGTHFNGQPMYGQLLNLLDRSKILRFSRESGGERYVKHFDAWQHLVIMLYAVIKRFDSLREITDSMFPEARKLAHLGINLMPRRSTLSDANSRRKECVFEAVYRDLYATYRDELSSDSRRKQVPEWLKRLQIIDSTTITLFSNLIFKGAGRNPKTGKKKGGIKVHANIHANEGVPSDIRFTSAATNDSFMLRPSNYACGDIVALDRAYIDYAKFEELTRREVIYVTKMKKNLVFDTVSDTMYMHPEGLMECRVQHVIFHKHVKDGEDIEHHARIITYVDIKNGKARLVSLLTNDMNMEVEDIVGIYRKRWEIELLFKQLKQNFPLRYFYGESANAIKIQIWVTLIANLLLMVMQRRIKRSWSFSNLATMFRIMLMYYVNCYTFFEHPERDWLKIIEMDNPQPDEPALFD